MTKTEIRVIYGDTDQMGVVYHANYLRYFEAGRNELLRQSGLRYRDVEERYGVFLPVVQAKVDYKAAGRYEDLLVVETELTKVGRASVRFGYRAVREGSVIATGHTTHACIDRAGRVVELPAELRAHLDVVTLR
jgi:acyl-CoA thioester hydrolase